MTKTIKAVVVANPGGVDRLEIREIPLRGVGPGDVRVSVRSIALNFRDLQQRRGVAAGSVYPLIPGSDFAGIVAEVGAQVEDFEPGDHVYGLVLDGAYAEEVVLPAAMLLRIPDGLDFATASILPVAGLSASFLLSVADLVDGASVVTFAAAGGLGCFLGGLLHRAGIRSIGLTSSADKARVAAAAGHHQVVNYHDVDPVDAVLAATGGKGVDVVFNSVAGPDFGRSFTMLANEGTVILCGRAAGAPDLTGLGEQLVGVRRNLGLREFSLATHIFDHLDEIPRRLEDLAGSMSRRDLTIPVASYPFDEVAAAHTAIESGATVGKLILTIGPKP